MNWLMFIYTLFRMDSHTKRWAENNLKIGDKPIPAAGGNILLQRTRNKGIAGGKLSEHPDQVLALSTASASVIGLNLLLRIFRKGGFLYKIAYSMLAAGAAGNLHDRFERGSVTDFIRVKKAPGPASKVVFNAADIFIVLGSILLIPLRIFSKD